MVNCALGLVMKLKRFSRACKWPTESWISSGNYFLFGGVFDNPPTFRNSQYFQ